MIATPTCAKLFLEDMRRDCSLPQCDFPTPNLRRIVAGTQHQLRLPFYNNPGLHSPIPWTLDRPSTTQPGAPPKPSAHPTNNPQNEQLLLPRLLFRHEHATQRAITLPFPAQPTQRRRPRTKRHPHGQRPAVWRPANRHESPVDGGAAAVADAGGEQGDDSGGTERGCGAAGARIGGGRGRGCGVGG